jgi:hypothetical protein
MATTKADAPWTSVKNGRIGISFETVAPVAKVPDKSRTALTILLFVFEPWRARLHCSHMVSSGCVLAARWIGLPVIEGPHFVLGTASLSILGYDPDHPTVPIIALWNAFSHEMLELLA